VNKYVQIIYDLLFVELFDVEYYDNLKCGLDVTQGHWKWHHSKVLIRLLIRRA